ncbi:MAG: glycosyltransferase [bacterium]
MIGDGIEKCGGEVKYILSRGYRALGDEYGNEIYFTEYNTKRLELGEAARSYLHGRMKEIACKYPPRAILFYNTHPLNPIIANRFKAKNPDVLTVLYLHDPYKDSKREYGLTNSLKINLVEIIQKTTAKYIDHVISPSENSGKIYRDHYKDRNSEHHICPLLIPDKGVVKQDNRRYFSMIGNVSMATGHDTFIQLINYVARKKLEYKFVLVSSNNIYKYTNHLTEAGKEKLTLVNKPIITDKEINEIVSRSYAVFRLDKEITQSGVIPDSYMNGTPVIVRDIPGLTQDVSHRENGMVISKSAGIEEIIEAMRYVEENINSMSTEARKAYENTWSDNRFIDYYGWLIDAIFK